MSNAQQIFEKLEELGDQALQILREQAFTPNTSKVLKTFTISQVSDMVGRSDTYIRNQEKLPDFPKGTQGKKGREYTLEQINEIRKFLNISPHKSVDDEPVIISYANFKGGAAKTTSAVHTAQYLALNGYRVLLIDCDSQASTTQMFGFNPDEQIDNDETLLNILIQDETDITKVIRKTYWDGLDLIPANLGLYNAEFILPKMQMEMKSKGTNFQFYKALRDAVQPIKKSYDIMILDCPPSLGMISMNAIYCSNAFIIPVPPSMLDFASTIQFFAMVKEVFSYFPGKEYAFIRLLITKHDNQDSNNKLVVTLRALYRDLVLNNMMYTSEAIRKTSSNMLTLYEVDKYDGSKSTHDRAMSHMNGVNAEIESLIRQVWSNAPTNKVIEKRLSSLINKETEYV
jgi:chromosome partitioning protein